MAGQVPFATYGLEEAVEQFVVAELENKIIPLYTAQQADSEIDILVASLWNRTQITQYPFVGVRAYMPMIEPEFIGDTFYLDQMVEANSGNPLPPAPDGSEFVGTFNDCTVQIHLECKSYRQMQRMSSFLWFTIDKGFDDITNESYLSSWRNWGIMVNGYKQTMVERVILDSLQREGDNRNTRTDQEILFRRDINLDCNVALVVHLIDGHPIAAIDVENNLTIIVGKGV